MNVRARAAVLAGPLAVAALLGTAGCSTGAQEPRPAPASVPASSAAALPATPPPLRLPVVRAGQPCPVSTAHAWTGWGQATRVLGEGPLYPIADYFRRDGATLELRPDDRTADGTYEKKVRWLGGGYRGQVLLRAARLDGPGSARAQFSYFGERRGDAYYAELTEAENDLPATTTVSGPGCFAYQVDGANLRETIVFRAVAVP